MKKKTPVHRLQFDFSSEALEQLDDRAEREGFLQRADLIRQAVRAHGWLADHRTRPEQELEVVVRDPVSGRELGTIPLSVLVDPEPA